MLYILLLISFIIHIVTFVIIRQMKVNQDRVVSVEQSVNEQVKNMEDTLAVYLMELKEENESFVKQIEKLQNKKKERDQQQGLDHDSQAVETVVTQTEVNEYQPITNIEHVEDVVESSTTASALHLHEQGYTLEEIARKLNKGKTEIALLLKFQQKN